LPCLIRFLGQSKLKIGNLKWALAVLTFLATLPAIAPAADFPKWKEDWSRVIEAAKQEGQLSLYGGQEITHPDIIAGFNKDFPYQGELGQRTGGRYNDAHCRGAAR